MALLEFEDLPSTKTPINSQNLNNNFKEILNMMWPVGRGFIDFTDTDYSNWLGFTWEKECVGLVPIGAGTYSDKNGKKMTFDTGQVYGEYEHELTIEELPNANLGIYAENTYPVNSNKEANAGYTNNERTVTFNVTTTSGLPTLFARLNGGEQPHNNIQPTKAVNYWKRVS